MVTMGRTQPAATIRDMAEHIEVMRRALTSACNRLETIKETNPEIHTADDIDMYRRAMAFGDE